MPLWTGKGCVGSASFSKWWQSGIGVERNGSENVHRSWRLAKNLHTQWNASCPECGRSKLLEIDSIVQGGMDVKRLNTHE